MDYICTNCSNQFPFDGEKPRCPTCLRRNGILPYKQFKNKTGSGNHSKKWYILGGLTILAIGSALFFYFKFVKNESGDKKSIFPYAIESFSTSKTSISKASGISITKDEFPLEITQEITKKANSLLSTDKIKDFIFSKSANRVSGKIPKIVRNPSQLLKDSENNTTATSLEWATLYHMLLTAANFRSAVIQIIKVDGDFVLDSPLLGRYGVALFEKDDYSQPTLLMDPSKKEINISDYKVLNSKKVISLFFSLKALQSAGGDPFLFSFITGEKDRELTGKKAKQTLRLIKVSKSINSKSANIYAVSAWIFHRLGLNKKAYKMSQAMASLSQAPSTKAFSAYFSVINGYFENGEKNLKNSPLPYLPLKAWVFLNSGKTKELKKILSQLKHIHSSTARFLEVMIILSINKGKPTHDLFKILTSAGKSYPKKEWPPKIAFRLFLQLHEFEKAKLIIPKIAAFSKNSKEAEKKLSEMVDKLIEETRKKDQPIKEKK
jgi:hypothetical protein